MEIYADTISDGSILRIFNALVPVGIKPFQNGDWTIWRHVYRFCIARYSGIDDDKIFMQTIPLVYKICPIGKFFVPCSRLFEMRYFRAIN